MNSQINFKFRPYTPMDTFQPGFTHMIKVHKWLNDNEISFIQRQLVDEDNYEPYEEIVMCSRSATLFTLRWSNLINVYSK